MANDGSDPDSALAKSQFLSRKEVVRRRPRRVKQLARRYRSLYWELMQEAKSKYREYYWTYGKSPFVNYQNNNGPNLNANKSNDNIKVTVDSDGVVRLKTGPLICLKPVLRSMRPPACPTHYRLD